MNLGGSQAGSFVITTTRAMATITGQACPSRASARMRLLFGAMPAACHEPLSVTGKRLRHASINNTSAGCCILSQATGAACTPCRLRRLHRRSSVWSCNLSLRHNQKTRQTSNKCGEEREATREACLQHLQGLRLSGASCLIVPQRGRSSTRSCLSLSSPK